MKNGSRFKDGSGGGNLGDAQGNPINCAGSALVYLNGTTDYVELGCQHSNTAASDANGGQPYLTFLTGALVRAA